VAAPAAPRVARRRGSGVRALLLALAGLPLVPLASDAPDRGSDARPLLVVAGAGGRLGREVLSTAAKSGFRLRALGSDPERARRDLGEAVYALAEWRRVDVRDAAQLRAALTGAGYVVSTIGARVFEGPMGPQQIDYRGNVNLADAAKAAGVAHFVLVTSGPSGTHKDQALDPVMGHVRLWKTMAEEHLKATGLPYTIVGPGGLSDVPAGREGVTVIPRQEYVSTDVSRADVARIIVDALRNPDARAKSFGLVGDRPGDPEAWRVQLRALPRDAGPPQDGAPVRIAAVGWLAGHWRSADAADGGPVSEEFWTDARAGTMVAVNRETRGERASFEFLRIEQRPDGGLVYLASPGGRAPPTEFRLTTLDTARQRAVFTSLSNDFPKMLTYRRDGDVLHARADGSGDGRRVEATYEWRRVGR
jgi:uncharacterized protein YbjT (DUF2867 family)